MDIFDVLSVGDFLESWRVLLCLALGAGICYLLWRADLHTFGPGTMALVMVPALAIGIWWEAAAHRGRRR